MFIQKTFFFPFVNLKFRFKSSFLAMIKRQNKKKKRQGGRGTSNPEGGYVPQGIDSVLDSAPH